jgi:hypothetical protein
MPLILSLIHYFLASSHVDLLTLLVNLIICDSRQVNDKEAK